MYGARKLHATADLLHTSCMQVARNCTLVARKSHANHLKVAHKSHTSRRSILPILKKEEGKINSRFPSLKDEEGKNDLEKNGTENSHDFDFYNS